MPIPSSTSASRPAVTCSPDDTTASYSRASCSGAASRHQAHQLVGGPRHGGDDHCHVVAGIDLAFDMASNVADALDIGDRSAAKLHYKAGHGGLAGFSGRIGGARSALRQAHARKRGYTYR